MATRAPIETNIEWHKFTRTLEQDERDIDGRLLVRGTVVICHPMQPDMIYEDTPSNRQNFLRLNQTWTPQARQQAWFPNLLSITDGLKHQVEHCRSVKNRFMAAIDENIRSARRQPIPNIKLLPFWFTILPWEPKIKQVRKVADLSKQLATCLSNESGVPSQITWPKEWQQWLLGLNGLTIYALRSMSTTIHVVAAVPSCVQFRAHGQPDLISPGLCIVDLIRDLYFKWAQDNNQHAAFVFFTLATALSWPEQMDSHASGNYWLVLSCPDGLGRWKTRVPRRFGDRLALRDFADRLKPETDLERVSRIKDFVDEQIKEGGNVTVARIKRSTGYRKSIIQKAFLTLQGQAGDTYRVYKMKDGQYAIAYRKNGEKINIKDISFRQRLIYEHGLRLSGVVLGVGAWLSRDMFNLSGIVGFTIFVLLVYITSRIQVSINRRIDGIKE